MGARAQYAEVRALFEGCITRGANGSALLLGPRGRGKSAITRRVLEDLEQVPARPPPLFAGAFVRKGEGMAGAAMPCSSAEILCLHFGGERGREPERR